MSRSIALAETLMSRLCHELIGPIGAVANGIEFMQEMEDQAGDAIQLVADSAGRASNRLQFYRLAYGEAGRHITRLDPFLEAAEDFLSESKIDFTWTEAPDGGLTGTEGGGKTILCLVEILARGLSRGGTLSITADGGATRLSATGPRAALGEEITAALRDSAGSEAFTPKTVHAVLAAQLIAELGLSLQIEDQADLIDLRLEPAR